MSLFIGKNTQHGSPIVVTENTYTVDQMNGPTLPVDTIYAAGLQYLTGNIFECTNITFTNNQYFRNIVTAKMTNECVDYINAKTTATHVPLVMYAINDKLLVGEGYITNQTSFVWNFLNTGALTIGFSPPISTYPNYTYAYKHLLGDEVGVTSLPASVKVLVTNLLISKNTGFGGIIFDATTLSYNSTDTVVIDNNSVAVNGVDISKLKLVSMKEGAAGQSRLSSFDSSQTITVANTVPAVASKFYADSNRVYLKNSNNEYIFDTNLGALHIKDIHTNLSFTAIDSTTHYINNVVADAKASFISFETSRPDSNSPTISPFGFAAFFPRIFTYKDLYDIQPYRTAYRYSVKVDLVQGILRYVFKRTIIYNGGEGDLGLAPPYPIIKGIVVLYE